MKNILKRISKSIVTMIKPTGLNSKLCINCKHHEESTYIPLQHMCNKHACLKVDVINGEVGISGKVYCRNSREQIYYKTCGPQGKFFEPKNSA